MELVYLWVEDYKNIKKQGFNFSPRFECKFSDEYETDKNGKEKLKDNCKLEITPRKHQSIFPDNINITAIVGENGSGKSSLGNLFLSSILQNGDNKKNANWREIKNILLVFNDHQNSKQRVFTFSGIKNESKEFMQFLIKINNIETETLYKKEENSNKYLTCISQDFFHESYYLFMDFSIMNSNFWNEVDFKKNFSLEPSRDYKTSGPEWNSKLSPTGFDSNMKSNLVYFYKYMDDDLKQKMNLPKFESIKIYGKKKVREDKISNELEQAKVFFTKNKSFLNLSKNNFDRKAFASDTKKLDDLTDDEMDAISYFDTFCDISLETKEKDIYFYHLSTGTKTLLSYFGIICKTIHKRIKHQKSIYIMIDELENSLHPNWQKKFVNLLVLFLSNWEKTKDIKIHLILLTHSPFILSDIPKENVIFLKDGKPDNPDIKQTFGANIHTLLSHGFFMKDGLMGEFAKNKIEEIKKFYELTHRLKKRDKTKKQYLWKKSYERRKTRFRDIQKIIGEPFLKTIMGNYLDELEQMFSTEDYKKAKKEELLKQFSKEELKAYLDEISD